MALPPGSFAACCPASTRWPAASRVASGAGLGWAWVHAAASSVAASRMRMAVALRGGHRHLVGYPGTLFVEEHAELLAQPLESRLGDVALPGRQTLHAPPCCLKRRNAATSRTDVDRDHPGDPDQREEPFPARA